MTDRRSLFERFKHLAEREASRHPRHRDELLSYCFEAVWNATANVTHEGGLHTYFVRAARVGAQAGLRELAPLPRGAYRAGTRMVLVEDADELCAEALTPEQVASAREELGKVRRAFARLPAAERLVLFREFDGRELPFTDGHARRVRQQARERLLGALV